MKQLYLLSVLFLFVSFSVYAQQGKKMPSVSGFSLSTNILTPLEPDGGISFVMEQRYANGWSILAETTAILFDNRNEYGVDGSDIPMTKGFRLRPEVRYYIPGHSYRYRLFFAQELLIKRVVYNESWHEYREDPTDPYNSYDMGPVAYKRRKTILGTSGKVGFQVFFDKENKYLFEMHVGLGIKHTNVKFADKGRTPGEGAYVPSKILSFPTPSDGWHASMPLGVKFGVRI